MIGLDEFRRGWAVEGLAVLPVLDVASWSTAENREECYDLIAVIAALRARLQAISDDLEEAICQTIPHGETVLIHDRVHKVIRDKGRKKWENADLLRAVLDSRRVDKDTGEIVDETPLAKVQHVYPLGGSSARLTALGERGIQPDEFCVVERRRLKLRAVEEKKKQEPDG